MRRNAKQIVMAATAAVVSTVMSVSSAQAAPLTWDPAGGGSSDGGGSWLGTGEWWDGSTNVDWTSGDDGTFGNGGAGGNVTLTGPTTANSLEFNAFSGTYTLGTNGQTLTVSNDITLNAGAGTVSFTGLVDNDGTDLAVGGAVAPVASRGAANVFFLRGISGAGGFVKNGDGVVWWQNVAPTYQGDTIVNGGVLRVQTTSGGYLNSIPATGNITLNGGVLEAYWGDTFTRSLGTGAGEIQLTGGASGFSEHGSNGLIVRLNNDATTAIQWGTATFNPSALVLQTEYADNTSRVTFQNALDLNGAQRTIQVSAGEDGRAVAEMTGILSDSTATTAGIIKTGTGLLQLNPANGSDYTFTGSIVGQGGRLVFGSGFSNTWNSEPLPATVNLELNDTIAAGYFSFSRDLGTGAGEVQITGGRSGFSILQGDRVDVTLGASEVVWGTATFNPTTFVLNDDAAGNGTYDSTSVLRFNNNIDLNGADRTIETPAVAAASTGGPNPQAFSQLINTGGLLAGNIRNTSGSPAGIIKTGPGILAFSGTNTFDGDITVNEGGVFFDSPVSMPATATVALPDNSFIGISVGSGKWSGATSGNGSIGGLLAGLGGQSGSTVTYAGNTDLGFNVVGDVTFAGDITNIGSSTAVMIARNTTGGATPFLSLGGNNTYSGGTTLNAVGAYTPGLGIDSATAIGTGALTINGGQLDNTSGSAVTLSTNNAQNWNSNFTFVGSNDLNMGTGAVTINGNRTVTVNGSTFAVGGIGQSGSDRQLIKAGAGTLAIAGTSSYTGATTVNAGTLLVDGSLAAASAVTVNNDAVLGGDGVVNGSVTLTGTSTLSPGSSPGSLDVGSLALGGTTNTLMELGGLTLGDEYDSVTVAIDGDLTYGGDLSVINYMAYDMDAATFTYDLFAFSGTTVSSGSFASVMVNSVALTNNSGIWSGVNGGTSYTFNQSTGDLAIVVPEPTSLALLGLGGLLMGRRRR